MMTELKPKAILWAGIAREQLGAGLAGVDAVALRQIEDFDEFADALPGAEILALPSYHYSENVAELVRERGGKLRFLQLLTAGYEQLERHGVPPQLIVASASPAMAPAVAEHAVALLLALARNIPAFVRRQQHNRWDRAGFQGLRSLCGARVAIVGFGCIGREIALRLKPLGAHIVAVSRARHHHALADEVALLDTLVETVATADAVILSLPYTAAYHHLVDASLLAAFKPGTLLVNIARGGLVDTDAVVEALESGHLDGYATDVAEIEPLPAQSPLWSLPNALITPHVAAADGNAGAARLARFAASNIARYLAGEPPESLVSFQPRAATVEAVH